MVSNQTAVTINGKEYGLTFGLLQVEEFEKACIGNLDIFFDDKSMITEAGLTRLIYAASQNFRMINPREPALPVDEIYGWIVKSRKDKNVLTQLTDVVKVWNASEHTQTWIDEKKKEAAAKEKQAQKLAEQLKKSKENLSKSKRPSGAKAIARKK